MCTPGTSLDRFSVLIKSSLLPLPLLCPSYVTRLAESVTSNLKSSERSLHKIGEIKQQRSDSRQEISDTEPKLANLVKDVRRIQTELEGDISKRYDNRPVHIVGEINAVEKMK
eukprot:m.664829 g.664829  ORF g.664829 m.664829 type:complete len:113 (+) comp58490_c0_seq52:1340-1678(+)